MVGQWVFFQEGKTNVERSGVKSGTVA